MITLYYTALNLNYQGLLCSYSNKRRKDNSVKPDQTAHLGVGQSASVLLARPVCPKT